MLPFLQPLCQRHEFPPQSRWIGFRIPWVQQNLVPTGDISGRRGFLSQHTCEVLRMGLASPIPHCLIFPPRAKRERISEHA